MAKRYDQYCPIAHALDLVGERWALLVVRELSHGPLRYTDLLQRLTGCGTNILAARLRTLEAGGVVARRTLPPPAASTVYELTTYGEDLRPVLHELAHWGARSLGPPGQDANLQPGWLTHALQTAVELIAPEGVVEFRVGEEVATLADGRAHAGHAVDPDVIVTTDPVGFFHLVVDRELTETVDVEGDAAVLDRLLGALEPKLLPA